MEAPSASGSNVPPERGRAAGRAVPPGVLAFLLALCLPLAACGGLGSGAAGPNLITGELLVQTSTSGSNLDPDGYTAVLEPGTEDEESAEMELNDSHTFTSVEPGFRIVELVGVAENCSVSGENPREVSILAGVTARTTFEVTCG